MTDDQRSCVETLLGSADPHYLRQGVELVRAWGSLAPSDLRQMTEVVALVTDLLVRPVPLRTAASVLTSYGQEVARRRKSLKRKGLQVVVRCPAQMQRGDEVAVYVMYRRGTDGYYFQVCPGSEGEEDVLVFDRQYRTRLFLYGPKQVQVADGMLDPRFRVHLSLGKAHRSDSDRGKTVRVRIPMPPLTLPEKPS